MKRKIDDSEATSESHGFLMHSQLSSLRLEVKRLKRELLEAMKELKANLRTSREKETIISLLQRAWSQLDLETGKLLEGFTEENASVDAIGEDVLMKYLASGDKTLLSNPTLISDEDILQFNIDRWSTREEIEEERIRISKEISASPPVLFARIEGSLGEHVEFTKRLVEKLLKATRLLENKLPSISFDRLVDYKAMQSERLALLDAVKKLKQELVNSNALYLSTSHDLDRLQRIVDKHMLLGDDAKPAKESTIEVSSNVTEVKEDSAAAASSDAKARILVLERQLAQSEATRREAQQAWSQPLQNGHKVDDGRAVQLEAMIEILRVQYKAKIDILHEECESALKAAHDLELALTAVEEAAEGRIEEVVAAAEGELKVLRDEKMQATNALTAAQSDLIAYQDLQLQYAELKGLEDAANETTTKCRGRMRHMIESKAIQDANLRAAREREIALEQSIRAVTGPLQHAGSTLSAHDQLLLRNALERGSQVEQELQDAQANMNDLISEIESVAAEEERARKQSVGLLRRIEDMQTSQRHIREENLRLLEQYSTLQHKYSSSQSRIEIMEEQAQKQSAVIARYKSAEIALQTSVASERKKCSEVRHKLYSMEEALSTHTKDLQLASSENKELKKLSTQLQTRCVTLSDDLDHERKLRIEKEVELEMLSKGKSALSSSSSAMTNGGKKSSIDNTLDILRCSICKDRFKDCTITRCYHVFCHVCIDDRIRSRQRKCPVCGEKFGQDDVKEIFMTD